MRDLLCADRHPVGLVPLYGTTTQKKSLRTKDEATAKPRLWPVIEAWRAEFDDGRARRQLTAEDKADATWQHYTASLERDEQSRQTATFPPGNTISGDPDGAGGTGMASIIDDGA